MEMIGKKLDIILMDYLLSNFTIIFRKISVIKSQENGI
jgi:hypothetical protein